MSRFFIAQHLSDPFRQEPRNIGVLFEAERGLVAKFFGERLPGEVDGRRIQSFEFPDVYREWIHYWRRTIAHRNGEAVSQILGAGGTHYRVISGGEITEADIDPPQDVLDYLYAMLVSEGHFAEAISAADERMQLAVQSEANAPLAKEVQDVFHDLNILAEGEPSMFVRHPVQVAPLVRGKNVHDHRPEFAQSNGGLYLIETIDFRPVSQRLRAVDHAGRTAYMFTDIRNAQAASPYSIVRLPDEGYEDDRVRYGVSLLRAESETVIWNDPDQRQAFLDERRRLAFA